MLWNEAVTISKKGLALKIENQSKKICYWHYINKNGVISSYLVNKNNFIPITSYENKENLKCQDWEPV